MPLSRTIRVARTREKSTPADCGIFPRRRPHHSSGKPIALQRHHRRGPARLPTSPRPRATARSSIAHPPHGGGEGGEGSGGDGGGGGGGDASRSGGGDSFHIDDKPPLPDSMPKPHWTMLASDGRRLGRKRIRSPSSRSSGDAVNGGGGGDAVNGQDNDDGMTTIVLKIPHGWRHLRVQLS